MKTVQNVLITFAVSVFSMSLVRAGTIWAGGGPNQNINTAANWNDDTVPALDGTATLTFGTGGSSATLNVAGSALGVVLNRGGNFSIDGPSTLTVGTGGLSASPPGNQIYTLAAAVAANGNQTWSINGGSTVVEGGLSGTGDITKSGGGNLQIIGAPSGLTGNFTVAAGRLTGTTTSPNTFENGISVSSGATLTQDTQSLFELTGAFSDVTGSVLASPNQSQSSYVIGSRGILFNQGTGVTVNGTIRPSAPNGNRFGVIGVNDNPSSSNATAMTITGVVQADIPTAHLNFTFQEGSSIYVAAGARIDNLHLQAKSRRSINFYGDGSAGATLELDAGFVADPVDDDDAPGEPGTLIDEDVDLSEVLVDPEVPGVFYTELTFDAANAVEFGFPRIAGITFITHANQSLPAAGISFNSIRGNITGVNTTATTWRTATNDQTYGDQVQVDSGTLTIDPNTDLTLTNTNSLTIGSGSVVVERSAGSGILQVDGGVLTSGSAAITIAVGNELRLNGTLTDFAPSSSALDVLGTLSGNGTVGTDVAIATGILSPGQSPGVMTFTEDLSLNSGSTLLMELDGTSPGNGSGFHDQLVTTGSGTLALGGGTLTVSLITGYTPTVGDEFSLFSLVSAPTGTFGTVSLPELDDGLSWDTSALYTTTGTIVVVDEPPAGVMVAALAAVAAVFHVTRKTRTANRTAVQGYAA